MTSNNTPRAGESATVQLSHISIVTPGRRAISAEPPSRRSLRTPGSLGRSGGAAHLLQRPGGAGAVGLSASGRKNNAATTPHGRAAIRAIDMRRAAIFTPHRDHRRRSLRDQQRETPRNDLRGLSRLLAPVSRPLPSSSSSPTYDGGRRARSLTAGLLERDDEDEDDEDRRPLKVPRLSLPLDADDDDLDLRPHRSAGLEDENLTMQSVELPRRAVSEQAFARPSIAGGRISEIYGTYAAEDDGAGIDSAFFPPRHAIDEDGLVLDTQEDVTYERIEEEDTRRMAARESDFGIAVPVDINESTFMISGAAEPLQSTETEHRPGPGGSPLPFFDAEGGGDGPAEQFDEEADEALQEDIEEQLERDMATARDGTQSSRDKKRKRVARISKYGIEYPTLPPSVVKRLAQTFAQTSGVKSKISSDTLAAIMQASDWFFEQLGDDLQAYAKHAGRKTIDESDVLTLMRRQRQINSSTTVFSLAQRYLPRELLQELRMPPPIPPKIRRKGKSREEDGG
ncbi:hypothetical protein VTK73DRAFT_10277 [Phialemonium thermophilum]|uniref:CENP-T/Histone H4 histone fold domain-containing protein n=1 Tax=Phialemonium thermophilum TaxID=223376 RepID=A0ABR3XGR3_9PEZI